MAPVGCFEKRVVGSSPYAQPFITIVTPGQSGQAIMFQRCEFLFFFCFFCFFVFLLCLRIGKQKISILWMLIHIFNRAIFCGRGLRSKQSSHFYNFPSFTKKGFTLMPNALCSWFCDRLLGEKHIVTFYMG